MHAERWERKHLPLSEPELARVPAFARPRLTGVLLPLEGAL